MQSICWLRSQLRLEWLTHCRFAFHSARAAASPGATALKPTRADLSSSAELQAAQVDAGSSR